MREKMVYNPGYYQLRETPLRRMLDIVEQTKTAEPGGIVFFGDSITQLYPVEEFYPHLRVYNCGIGGATSRELLSMVDEGVIKYRPRLVVLAIGTNDMGNTVMYSPRHIAANVRQLVDMIHRNCPDAKVLLWSTLPCVEALRDYRHVPGIRCNDLLHMVFSEYRELFCDDYVRLLDVFPAFVDATGEARMELYQDGLHINHAGYVKLTELLAPVIDEMLAE